MERLLGTEDLTERLPFSLSKIQEMAKAGEIPDKANYFFAPPCRYLPLIAQIYRYLPFKTLENQLHRLALSLTSTVYCAKFIIASGTHAETP